MRKKENRRADNRQKRKKFSRVDQFLYQGKNNEEPWEETKD
jgi:hypothetical protein